MNKGQTKTHSAIEAVINVLIGYTIAIIAQIVIFPLFDMHPSFSQNLQIGACFTVVSLVRSYVLRRIFNYITVYGRPNHLGGWKQRRYAKKRDKYRIKNQALDIKKIANLRDRQSF